MLRRPWSAVLVVLFFMMMVSSFCSAESASPSSSVHDTRSPSSADAKQSGRQETAEADQDHADGDEGNDDADDGQEGDLGHEEEDEEEPTPSSRPEPPRRPLYPLSIPTPPVEVAVPVALAVVLVGSVAMALWVRCHRQRTQWNALDQASRRPSNYQDDLIV